MLPGFYVAVAAAGLRIMTGLALVGYEFMSRWCRRAPERVEFNA